MKLKLYLLVCLLAVILIAYIGIFFPAVMSTNSDTVVLLGLGSLIVVPVIIFVIVAKIIKLVKQL